MKFKNETKFMKRKWLALLMMFAIILSSASPIFAADVTATAEPVAEPVMDYSPWAISLLNEGEKYGIFSMDWYYDAFKSQISEERLDALIQSVDDKLSDVSPKIEFTPLVVSGKRDRQDVLTRLYNVLGSYNLVASSDAMGYMQLIGVLGGTNRGLELNKACNTEQAVLFATKTVNIAFDTLKAGGKGVFWKVEKGGNTVYLLGSIHIGSTDLYPLNEMLTDAFYGADTLLVEADILNSQSGMEYYQSKAFYTDGTTIKDHVTAEVYADLLKVFETYGLDPAIYGTLKPWSLANTLSALTMMSDGSDGQTTNANLGLDVYFLVNAYLTGKPVVELEGVPYQTDLFNNLSPEFQTKYLNSIIETIVNPVDEADVTSEELLSEWLKLWRMGDLENFKESFTAASSKEDNELNTMLFGERDKNMATKIQALLDASGSSTYFVVVGAGHYINSGSVVDILTEKGYTVEWMY